ncbi:AraC family transcriptional regulator [uncultured Polaribacter sp.]|uniref:helix-turn-helix domain-containing protein n=1 Tax=uncultured Polaribacter sp. TaxID=174711 RepID=UPI00262F3CC1|nr:helix-turn-helix domain-containing protein [uncultured Polaribacter sp.]
MKSEQNNNTLSDLATTITSENNIICNEFFNFLYKKYSFQKQIEVDVFVNEKFPLNDKEWLKKMEVLVLEQIIFKKKSWEVITSEQSINQPKLRKRIVEVSGTNLVEFQKKIQFKLACNLLTTKSNLNIKEISKMVGYRDVRYFSKEFKKYFRVIPTVYRKLALS